MRIAITSNLHLHITGKEPLRRMVAGMSRYKPDAVVIAGNVASGLVTFEECLSLFLRLDCPVVVLAGRADLYAHNGADSLNLLQEALPSLVREVGFHWLEGNDPVVLGNVAIAGSMVRCHPPTWDDPEPLSDTLFESDFPEATLRRLRRQMQVIQRDDDIRHALLVTHEPLVQNMEDLVVPGIPALPAEGCDDVVSDLLANPKIRWMVCGAPEDENNCALDRDPLPPLAVATVGSGPFSPRYTFVDTSEA